MKNKLVERNGLNVYYEKSALCLPENTASTFNYLI